MTVPHSAEWYQERAMVLARQMERVVAHIDTAVTPAILLDRSGGAVGGIHQDRRIKCVDCGGAAFALDCPDGKPRVGCLDCGYTRETPVTTARLRKHLAQQDDLQATIDAIWELVEQAYAGPIGVGGVISTADLRRVLRGDSSDG